MPAVTLEEASKRLRQSVEAMNADDLLDFHNEVFPDQRKSELDPPDSGVNDRRKILEYMDRGLEVDEMLDFWHVIFPGSRNLHYDEEDGMLHYRARGEAVSR